VRVPRLVLRIRTLASTKTTLNVGADPLCRLLTKHYPLERFEFVKRARRKDYSDKKCELDSR
jgi:hypothetical protein